MSAAKKWIDPFDDMSDADFDTHVDGLFAARPSAVAVSFRVAPDLLGRVKVGLTKNAIVDEQMARR